MKILFAEDNLDVREFYCSILSDDLEGVEIKEVDNGKNAILELLEKNKSFDLVIADYFMPNGHGDIICEYLESNKSNIPFIFLTSKPYDEITGKLKTFPLRPGLDHYLKKTGNIKTFHYKMHDIFTNILSYIKKEGIEISPGLQKIADTYMKLVE